MPGRRVAWFFLTVFLAGFFLACSPKPIITGKFGAGVASKIEKVPVPSTAILDARPDPVVAYTIPNEDDLKGLAEWYNSRFPLNSDWERGWKWCAGAQADAKGEGFRRHYRRDGRLLSFSIGGARTINDQDVLSIAIAVAEDLGATC
ncbi:MAG TPA: hypothetical protein VI541_01080 [Actinomycetota bacterium]|nr:hypothetical protein [Actinomycetota bacterium]